MATRQVALLVALACTSWSLAYVIYGNSRSGHSWIGDVSARIFEDYKGGVPVLTLALPLLFSSSTCALLLLAPPSMHRQSYVAWSRILAFPHTAYHRLRKKSGGFNFDILSLVFILVPCIFYLVSGISRHLSSDDSTDRKLKEVGNAFGQMAMVALSFFLVPVARHSPLLALMGWSPINAVRMHIWSGRICIVGVALHGLAHMARWWQKDENLLETLIPNGACWSKDTNCKSTFRNFTGFLALVALLIIGGSSIGYVRRKSYRLFYTIHATAGPCALLMTILHWNRMILFLCPSILYYAASSVPVFVESLRSYMNDKGVKMLSVANLVSTDSEGELRNRPCVSLTFEVSDEAMSQYRPGQYVLLKAPNLSKISHPFTVIKVPRQPNQMRIIFRATGPFTRKLAKQLLNSKPSETPSVASPPTPILLMDGFYGQQRRIDQARSHDAVVMIAGGIGITPYISMLCQAKAEESSDNVVGMIARKKLTLHWICRDSTLIDYVSSKYFAPLLDGMSKEGNQQNSCRIRIVIHMTNSSASSSLKTNTSEDHSLDTTVPVASMGAPFHPSRFSAGTRESMLSNLPYFLTFTSIAWLGLFAIYYIYTNIQSKSVIISRAYGLLAVLAISLVVSYIANIIIEVIDRENALSRWRLFQRHTYTGLLRNRKEHASDNVLFTDEFAQETEEDMERGLSLPNIISSGNNEKTSSLDATDVQKPCNAGRLQEGQDGVAFLQQHSNKELASPISLERSAGRPSPHVLLSSLDSAESPGIFCCGPEGMVKGIRSAARTRCSMRIQQCVDVATPTIYEETFEV